MINSTRSPELSLRGSRSTPPQIPPDPRPRVHGLRGGLGERVPHDVGGHAPQKRLRRGCAVGRLQAVEDVAHEVR